MHVKDKPATDTQYIHVYPSTAQSSAMAIWELSTRGLCVRHHLCSVLSIAAQCLCWHQGTPKSLRQELAMAQRLTWGIFW